MDKQRKYFQAKAIYAYFYKKISFIFINLLLFPLALYSQHNYTSPEVYDPTTPFWKEMRQSTQVFHLENWPLVSEKVSRNHLTLTGLLNQQIFQDHFFNKFQDSQSKEAKNSTFAVISVFLTMLKNGSTEAIKEFMLEHHFTRSDKILTVLLLTIDNQLGENIFDLMKSIDLSVNDTLAYRDINSLFIDNTFRHSDHVITVLSHHLASTGDLKIIKRLFDTDYDPSIKTHIEENILHSFTRLSSIRRSNNLPVHPDHQQAFHLIVRNSQQIINEKNILGFTPLFSAVDANDRLAVKILMDSHFSANLNTNDLLNRNLKDIAKSKNNNGMLAYLNDKLPPEFDAQRTESKKSAEFVYLNFEPFIKNMVHWMATSIPGVSSEYLNGMYNTHVNTLETFESIRKQIISPLLLASREREMDDRRTLGISQFPAYFKAKEEVNKKMAPVFKAISNRDSHFFEQSTEEQKKQWKTFFLSSIDKQPYFVTNFLLESIRNSFLPAVQYMLNNYKETDIFPVNTSSLSLDPLSLSLIAYASLEEKHPLKKEAGKIIRAIANHTDFNKAYPHPLEFSPMTWATLLGLLDEIKFLHENKGMELITHLDGPVQNGKFDIMDYTKSRGFMRLSEYLGKKIGVGQCRKIFYH